MTRYNELANLIESQIRSGKLGNGDRLASVREMSAREKVSPSTVVEAYGLLQERGLIEPRDRSGYFVSSPGSLLPIPDQASAPGHLIRPDRIEPEDMILTIRQAAQDPKILPLGAAMPSPVFFPHKAMSRAIAHVLREEPTLSAEYLFPPGTLSLRKEVSRRYVRLGVEADANSVVTTSGTTESIVLALKVVAQPGDVILVESPTYFGILQTLRSYGYQIYEAPVHPSTGLSPETFRDACKKLKGRLKAAIIVPNHSNPLGSCMPDAAKAEVMEIARKENVTIIEDDVYGGLSFQKVRPKPLKYFDKEDRVILCGSYTKTMAAGLRVGYVISTRYHKELTVQRSANTCGVSVVAEEATAYYLSEGAYDRHMKKMCREYQTLVNKFSGAIAQTFPHGTRVSQPHGGYVLWVQLPDGTDSRIVQKLAFEKKVSIAAGSLFSITDTYKSYIRINCAVPWSGQVERGIERLGDIVQKISISSGL